MGVENYERQMEDAFALYKRLGIRAVKTGYVGDKTADGHAHHGQYMVRHWRKVLELAARHGDHGQRPRAHQGHRASGGPTPT